MKKICKIFRLLIIILLILISITTFKLLSGYEIYHNVKYGTKDINVMDIYLPDRALSNKENGCVLFIHGGSWSGGDKKEEDIRCRLIASHGYVAASINYTLRNEKNVNEYSVFNVLDEIELSLLKVKDFSLEKGINITKFATSGYSAGAHLSMLYSFSRIDTSPLDIVFTSNMAGPSDISSDVWGEELTNRIAFLLTGKDITNKNITSEEVDMILSSISPVSYINENTPPSIIIHGGKDTTVPPENADSLISKFTEYSIPYDYIYLEDSDHMLIQNPIKHLNYMKTLLNYCKKYFNY